MNRPNETAARVSHLRLCSARMRALTTSRKLPARTKLSRWPIVIWRPSPEVLEHANVVRLMRRHGIDSYRELVRRSQDDPEWFWPAAIEDMGLEFSTPWDDGHGPLARAGVGDLVRRRHAEHRLELRAPLGASAARRGRGGRSAGENGDRREVTFAEMSAEVTRLAEGLAVARRRARATRVAIFLPMSPEVAIASHACAHLGAIQVPVFSGLRRARRRRAAPGRRARRSSSPPTARCAAARSCR